MRLRSGLTYDPLYTGDKGWLPVYDEENFTYTDNHTWMPHGEGVLRLPNGTTFSGDCFYKGKIQGWGCCELPNGSIYTGELLRKKFLGTGTLVCPNGTILEGEWYDNQLHGNGKITQISDWNLTYGPGNSISYSKTWTITTGWWWHGKYFRTQKKWEKKSMRLLQEQMDDIRGDEL